MKRIASIFLACIIMSGAAVAQQSASAKFRFSKKISLAKAGGKNFRYEMAVRANDQDADVTFYGVAANANGRPIPGKFDKVEKRREQEWVIYTVVGQLPDNAASVFFYTDISSRGTYYFDDISLYVEQSAGQWKQLDVENASFEQMAGKSLTGFALAPNKTGNPKASLSADVFKTGRHSLMISFAEHKEIIHLAAGE